MVARENILIKSDTFVNDVIKIDSQWEIEFLDRINKKVWRSMAHK